MSDLVERLRHPNLHATDERYHHEVVNRAADEIERLNDNNIKLYKLLTKAIVAASYAIGQLEANDLPNEYSQQKIDDVMEGLEKLDTSDIN